MSEAQKALRKMSVCNNFLTLEEKISKTAVSNFFDPGIS